MKRLIAAVAVSALLFVPAAAFAGTTGPPITVQTATPALVNQNVDACLFFSSAVTFLSGRGVTINQADTASYDCSLSSVFFASEVAAGQFPQNAKGQAQESITLFDQLAISDANESNTNAWRASSEAAINEAKTSANVVDLEL